jgi:hypothetical protein
MIRAFERSEVWRQAVQHNGYWVFDEWWGTLGGSMMDVYHQMLLEGELRARPTRLALAQDTVVLNERGTGSWIAIDRGAAVRGAWRTGVLVGQRTGPCLCPNDTAFTPIAGLSSAVLSGCTACLRQQGAVRVEVTVHRNVELLGLHFQDWKKRWAAGSARRDARGGLGGDGCRGADFDLGPDGFRCADSA